MGRGNESLFVGSGSLDQDGHHAHIWWKPFKNLLLQNQRANDSRAWYAALGTIVPYKVCSNDDLGLTLFFFYGKEDASLCFYMGKYTFLQEKCHLMEETYNKWPEWQKVYVDIKVLTPVPGLYTCIKTWKNMYKIMIYLFKNGMLKYLSLQKGEITISSRKHRIWKLFKTHCKTIVYPTYKIQNFKP